MMRRAIGKAPAWAAAGLLLVALSFAVLPAQAIEICEVTSSKGIKAWLVEDHSLPLVALRLAFKGGSTQDPAGKEGLATLMTGLFDEGAGALDREAFADQLDEAGAEMGFSAGQDAIYGTMRVLSESREKGFALLRDALVAPRFDDEPFERIRAQLLSGVADRANDPQSQAAQRWRKALYGNHPYARDDNGSEASLRSMTQDDLRAFHAAQFARSNLTVGVVGAIDAETLKRELDRLFGDLPAEPKLTPVPDVAPVLAQEVRFDYPLPQATLQLAFPGVKRADPRYFAAVLMNEILGGGGMGSQLFEEVREKRGLAYGVDSSLVGYDHSESLTISTATRAERTAETLAVIRETVRRMATDGPSASELAAIKRYLIGAYAINNLGSSGAIASTLVELQRDDLPIDYMDRRTALIDAVTIEQVKQVARDLLLAEPAVLIVGPPLVSKAAP